jgi:hypothetical protein
MPKIRLVSQAVVSTFYLRPCLPFVRASFTQERSSRYQRTRLITSERGITKLRNLPKDDKSIEVVWGEVMGEK